MDSLPSFEQLYGPENVASQKVRYEALAQKLRSRTGSDDPVLYVSSPGRTELGGSHTDHNHGKVLCASVQQDMAAAVQHRTDGLITLESEGFEGSYEVDTSYLDIHTGETGHTQALIRGVLAGFVKRGYKIGGFDAVVQSGVPVGSGLSSSASFEVLIGGILSALYNDNTVSPVHLAQIGQWSENVYFGKPCGLMDQLACSVGGVLAIDFKDIEDPAIHKVEVDFSKQELILTVVHTGGSHADLTPAYAAIPNEMKEAARLFGGEVLMDVDEVVVGANLGKLRASVGDRATLRALHFYAENHRVQAMQEKLGAGDFPAFLKLVQQSGQSSLGVLQNIIPPGSDGREQPVALALGASNLFFEKAGRGVCRIQGGGFAGTIQAYVHAEEQLEYFKLMESLFGEGCAQPLNIRPFGVTPVTE